MSERGKKEGKWIEYTRHVRIRMLERNWVGRMVEDVLADPDRDYPGHISDSTVAVRELEGFQLHVCYLEFKEYILICSVFEDEP